MDLVLLCRWLQTLDPMANCSVDSLLSDAACFACLDEGERSIVRTQLMCEILQAGGGTGSVCIRCGSGPPAFDPNCDCAFYYDPATGEEWLWDESGGAWRQQAGGP